ncbi:MAG TPA: M50 family metallopeptidase [Anaerolineales bacterium]
MSLFSNIFDWALTIFLFGLLLFIHEAGHFVMARLTGVKVEEFGFGFPPRLKKLFTWQGTEFTLNFIPFGAFVRPLGEDDPSVPGGLASASKRVRFAVLCGGVLANLLAAILAFTIGFKIAYPDGVVIYSVVADTPAQQAGLSAGDKILSVDGVAARNTQQVIDYISAHLGTELMMQLERGAEIIEVRIVPRATFPQGQGPTGIVISPAYSSRHSWFDAFGMGLTTMGDQVKLIVQLPSMILRGTFNASTERPVGPVGILDVTQQIVGAARQNNRWVIILSWIGMINLALAIGNILPIPALDGGRLVFIYVEAIRGKRVNPEKERMVHAYTLLVLLVLMLFVTYLDFFFPVLPR